MKRIPLGHVFDITEYVNEHSTENFMNDSQTEECIYEHGYFIAHDVWCNHVYRVLDGWNSEYEREPRTKLVEENEIDHRDLLEWCEDNLEDFNYEGDIRNLTDDLVLTYGLEKVLWIVFKLDCFTGFENYDLKEYRYDAPFEELYSDIDGGYGTTKVLSKDMPSDDWYENKCEE